MKPVAASAVTLLSASSYFTSDKSNTYRRSATHSASLRVATNPSVLQRPSTTSSKGPRRKRSWDLVARVLNLGHPKSADTLLTRWVVHKRVESRGSCRGCCSRHFCRRCKENNEEQVKRMLKWGAKSVGAPLLCMLMSAHMPGTRQTAEVQSSADHTLHRRILAKEKILQS